MNKNKGCSAEETNTKLGFCFRKEKKNVSGERKEILYVSGSLLFLYKCMFPPIIYAISVILS